MTALPRRAPEPESYRVGIDVGGTFTDFVLADLESGALVNFKEPSTPHDPSLAVERGLAAIMAQHSIGPEQVAHVVHGTTIGLNAVIQRRGARIALVASRGNRDVLEIARCRMASPYDFRAQKEEPLVPRDLVFETSARGASDGSVMAFPDAAELEALAAELRAAEVSAVAVMLLNAYANPQLERDFLAALQPVLPDVLLSASTGLWPEIREYERSLVTTLNAYVHPLMTDYVERLRARLERLGMTAPLYITASNGGSLSVADAMERPIETLLSGPASGVVAAARVASSTERRALITIDMGGTSCDMSVCRAAVAETTTQTRIGDFPLVLPVVNVSAIGAGGGSIVWVDPQGVLKVGPESAGADPGPACYGQGGRQATITDCYVALGYIHPDRFLGGRMGLDAGAAARALAAVAERLGGTGDDRVERFAESAVRVATAKMATELYKGLAKQGLDPRRFTLVPFGGAGPTQANLLAEEARLEAILVPRAPGLFCALGALIADVQRDFVRSQRLRLSETSENTAVVDQVFRELESEAERWLDTGHDIVTATERRRSADLRYVGQAYELSVEIPDDARHCVDLATIAELFHREHERVHGFADRSAPIEFHTLRVTAVGRVPRVPLHEVEPAASPHPREMRPVWHQNSWQDMSVYARDSLGAGAQLPGPALIEQDDTTAFVLPGWRATVDTHGNLLLTREEVDAA